MLLFCGGFFFDFNYPTLGVDNRKKNRRTAVLFLHFPADTGADIRYRYR